MPDKPAAGRVALLTGASRGIGRAIAVELAAAGAKVYVNYLSNEAKAKETLEAVRKAGGEAVLKPFDISDAARVNKSVDEIVKESSKIDILVNNAGITRDGLLMRMKDADWDTVIDTNLKGTFNVTRAVIRHMVKARYGRIVNVSSVVGQGGHEGQANYSAAKAGVEGFTKSVAKELARRNITCNAVAPGFIETELTAGLDEKARKAIFEQIPMARFGTPREVASVVLWLVSDAASYVTGAVIPVNGGIYM